MTDRGMSKPGSPAPDERTYIQGWSEKMKRLPVPITLILAALALATLPSCASSEKTGSVGSAETASTTEAANKLPDEQPDIRGLITKSDSIAGSRFILVEENPADTAGSQKASVRFNNETKIYRRSGSGVENIDQAKLTTGKTVSVWFTGPVAQSYPVQGTAAVVLLED